MATTGFAGASILEAYVTNKLHKEKMKELVKKEAADQKEVVPHNYEEKKSKKYSASFLGVFKKRHAAKVISSVQELDY